MTTPSQPKWGLVSTTKADAKSILDFAAYHLDLGAHRLHLYLDAENPDVYPHLKAHPKIRVITCDDRYWKQHKAPRPKMHQPRQTMNATHAYERIQTDWIAHIDVDEFLWPHVAAADQSRAITETLAALPAETDVLRMRPLEALAGHADHYKAMVPSGGEREHEVRAIYPEFGVFLKGGFLSHTAGKLFARTGLPDIQYRIHNLFQHGEKNTRETEQEELQICHRHAASWDDWQGSYRFRLARGSYRPGLGAGFPARFGGLNKHELLTMIEQDHGIDGLRRFFGEINAELPEVYDALRLRGMIHYCPLDLAAKRRQHFPQFD
ncbi:glycosyltransferase family 2 protein [Phaeobacter sp. S60]|uniref:glycosyltransferase family 2 protein n=1 Tax=Phaeobacter sp. S60 TaxID=1569353 RepID=UPI000590D63C|nr:glycosyltransferase family 2 protein [Phaeobacter sp. S60]KII19227.1 glycosyl transferase family 2 [Phaeobacter sp. S60]